jgi:Ni/Fe-hydrogenase subunit HybB-like protein
MVAAKYVYYAPVRTATSKYRWTVGMLGTLALGWLVASFVRFTEGLHITGMSHSVTWAGAKVIFVLFVGLSAGSLIISALSNIFGQKEYKILGRISAFNSVLFMVGALMMLISDWGRPDRILLPFYMINPRSLLSLNAFIYTTYMIIGILYLWAQIKENDKASKVLAIAAVITAVFVHSGTGFIFGVINGREMFFSSITPLAFVVAALSSGSALAMIVLYFTFKMTGRFIDQRFFVQLSKVMLGLIIFVFYLVTIEHLTHLYVPEALEGERYVMFSGSFFSLVFWVQLYAIGLIGPIAILLNPKTRSSIKWILGASAMHVIGVIGERILFILPGQFLPVPIFPGYKLSSPFLDGQVVSYIPHLAEWFQFAGIFGFIALAYIIGIRVLPLLPLEAAFDKDNG